METIDAGIAGNGWSAEAAGGRVKLDLHGAWAFQEVSENVARSLEGDGTISLVFDATRLESWDSSLLVFLTHLRRRALTKRIRFDDAGLPQGVRRLLALLPEQTVPEVALPPRRPWIEGVGAALIGRWVNSIAITGLLGDVILKGGAALCGRARMRKVDLVAAMYNSGIAALPVVALVNVLVGAILAFVGAVQLRRVGADIYVANLVGVAEVREMAAVMTAIVVSGRTGGAYAAEIAAMIGTDEIDALRVFGIPVQEYLILPKVLALTLMMPILYLYGSILGILGGFIVAVLMLNISPETFLNQTIAAVHGREVVFGLVKSVTFGAMIALLSCRLGLTAGRNATDVGAAATRAVVVGIVGVIVIDALCAVCANALGF